VVSFAGRRRAGVIAAAASISGEASASKRSNLIAP